MEPPKGIAKHSRTVLLLELLAYMLVSSVLGQKLGRHDCFGQTPAMLRIILLLGPDPDAL